MLPDAEFADELDAACLLEFAKIEYTPTHQLSVGSSRRSTVVLNQRFEATVSAGSSLDRVLFRLFLVAATQNAMRISRRETAGERTLCVVAQHVGGWCETRLWR